MALVAPAAPTSPMACNLLPPPLWVWYLLVLCHRCKSHGHAITLSIFLSLLSTALSSFCSSIYLSICLSHIFFYLYIYLSIYLCISLFVWMSLNNSSHSSYSHSLSLLHLLSLYLSRSLPPSLSGAMVPTVVQLWYYMQYRILSPQKDVTFSAYPSVEFGPTHV